MAILHSLEKVSVSFLSSLFIILLISSLVSEFEQISAELQALRESVSAKLETILDAVHRITPAATNTSHMAPVDSAPYTFPSEQYLSNHWDGVPQGTWMSN
jgi:hypothetical protein